MSYDDPEKLELPYSADDVAEIQHAKGKAYPRLHLTVLQRDILKSQLAGAEHRAAAAERERDRALAIANLIDAQTDLFSARLHLLQQAVLGALFDARRELEMVGQRVPASDVNQGFQLGHIVGLQQAIASLVSLISGETVESLEGKVMP